MKLKTRIIRTAAVLVRPFQSTTTCFMLMIVLFIGSQIGLRWWDYQEREKDRKALMAYAFIAKKYTEEIHKLNVLGVLGKVIKQSEEIAKQRGARLNVPLENAASE